MDALWSPFVETSFEERVRSLVAEVVAPDAARLDREDVYPTEAVRALAAAGFTTTTLAERWGGLGLSLAHAVCVFEEVARASAATATSLITIYQAQTIIELFGNDSLRSSLLPRFRHGLRCSYALTEAAHGSDLHHLDTKAVREGDGWRLDGVKAFVTSGSAADLFVILAETPVGVSAFAVPRETAGLSIRVGPGAATFGLRNGPHVDVCLDGALLPLENLIGEEGRGVRLAATTLDYSRLLAAAISLGLARAAFEGALAHARRRIAFDKHLLEFQGIQWLFADMLAEIDAARALTNGCARECQAGHDLQRFSSEAKLLASRTATHVATQAIQILGAQGTREDSPFFRYLRDAKAYEIAGGASEILKNTIGRHLLRMADGAPGSP